MRYIIVLLLLYSAPIFAQPVFMNPGIPASETFEITEYIYKIKDFVTTKVNVSVRENNGRKFYLIKVEEGDFYLTEIELNYVDLTTVSEKRTDLKTKTLSESFVNLGNNKIHFFNSKKHIDKDFINKDKNIYSRYAYYFSFRGFPFSVGKSVSFSTYFQEYGDALPMKLTCISKMMVKVKAGTFECYKLELVVGGWQSVISSDKYYLYFAVAGSHPFIKYEEADETGKWNANELIKTDQIH